MLTVGLFTGGARKRDRERGLTFEDWPRTFYFDRNSRGRIRQGVRDINNILKKRYLYYQYKIPLGYSIPDQCCFVVVVYILDPKALFPNPDYPCSCLVYHCLIGVFLPL